MGPSDTLAHLLEGLQSRRERPWNVAAITESSLGGLFAGREELINEIAISPLDHNRRSNLEQLRIYPTGWADLIVVDATWCVDLQPDQLWSELARIAAIQGLMVVLLPETPAAGSPWCLDDLSQASIGPYAEAFGTKPWPESGQRLHWAKRNSRPISPGRSSSRGLDRVTRQLDALTDYVNEVSQSLPPSSTRTPAEPDAPRRLQSADRSPRLDAGSGQVGYLEAMLSDLHAELQARQQDWRAAQAELVNLKQRYTSLRHDLATAASHAGIVDSQEGSADQVTEILMLRQQLDAMTASYLEMRDTVHGLIHSRFWRITWLPRRLLDRLRVSLQAPRRLLPSRWPRRALPLLKSNSIVAADGGALVADEVPVVALSSDHGHSQEEPILPLLSNASDSNDQHPALWQTCWTGSFLTLHDNSTAASQHRLDRILFVDWRLPEPDQDSGSCRIFAILEIVVSLGLRVDFISDSENQNEKYRDALLHLGIHVIEGRQQGLRHLQRFGVHYRQCFVCRPEPASFYFPLIRCFCPEAQLIYDTVDLHYSRFYRGSRLTGLSDVERTTQHRLHLHYKSAEAFLARSSDCIAVVTELEKNELMASIAPDKPLVVLPNVHELPPRDSLPAWEERQDILFVGGFDHAPNVDAVHYFCELILPLVLARVPDLTLHVVGSKMPAEIRNLKAANVNPIGYVEDLRQIYDRTRVFVAPLRYGAGLKGKVGQSMSYGVPVVGTAIAFEGFGIVNERQGMIADQPQDFAKALIRTYSDPALWQTISTQAWDLIDERFSTQAVRRSLQSLLQTAVQ